MQSSPALAAPAERVPEPATVEDALLAAMARMGRRLRHRVAGDLDFSTFVLLKTVAHRGPLRLSALASELALDASTVSRHVRSLESAGIPLEGVADAIRRGALTLDFLDAAAYERFAALAPETFRQVSERTQSETEFLARELAGVRLILADVVTGEELREQLSELTAAVEALGRRIGADP